MGGRKNSEGIAERRRVGGMEEKSRGWGAGWEAPGGRTSTERGAKSGGGGADPGGNGGESGRGAPAAKKTSPKLQTSRASDWPEREKRRAGHGGGA